MDMWPGPELPKLALCSSIRPGDGSYGAEALACLPDLLRLCSNIHIRLWYEGNLGTMWI